MNICVIPARGGSKRIFKKNLKFFCGKPIICWSIEIAKASKCFDRIIVSTDDKKIALIAKKYGAEVPFIRPKSISGDFTPTVPVISHAIKWLIKNHKKPLHVCCVYATAPFIKIDDLKTGLKILKKNKFNYVFPVTNFAYPIQRSFKINKDKTPELFFLKKFHYRSQDLEEAFHDAGQFYWGKTDAWLNNKQIINKNSFPMVIPRARVLDIDTIEDWKIAEKMLKIRD